MISPTKIGYALFMALLIGQSFVVAAPPSLEVGFSADLGVSGGGTTEQSRSLLPRKGYSGGLEVQLTRGAWIPIGIGIHGFQTDPSLPDPSLFLYRGYGGILGTLGTGLRIGLDSEALGGLAGDGTELTVLASLGLAAIGDTGSTLVGLVPLVRVEPKLIFPLHSGFAWTLGLPIEASLRSGAYTIMAGACLGIALPTLGGPRK